MVYGTEAVLPTEAGLPMITTLIVENVEEKEKASKEVIKKLVPNSPPIIVEDVTDTNDPTLERHLIDENLMQIALDVVKDASLLSTLVIM